LINLAVWSFQQFRHDVFKIRKLIYFDETSQAFFILNYSGSRLIYEGKSQYHCPEWMYF
jgi:hypothetical protein